MRNIVGQLSCPQQSVESCLSLCCQYTANGRAREMDCGSYTAWAMEVAASREGPLGEDVVMSAA